MSPLPNAKPDKRIYQLLKTTDLQNLTFSDFQKVAETIFAEQGAEGVLRVRVDRGGNKNQSEQLSMFCRFTHAQTRTLDENSILLNIQHIHSNSQNV